jgi:GNAT superfamily N-acetyltransferase
MGRRYRLGPLPVTAGRPSYRYPVGPVEILPVPYDDPRAGELLRLAMADLGARYGGSGDQTPVDPAEFAPPAGAFLIARLAQRSAGCGGWRTLAADPDAAEIKRMFTVPAFRGRGVASALLAALEESARSAGKKRIVLETGDRQPEAIALYVKLGYERIPDFGYYRDHDGVRSFGRSL